MDARALVMMLPADRMREKPNKSANSAYARPLPAVTAPQAWTVIGLLLAGRATRRRAGKVPGNSDGDSDGDGEFADAEDDLRRPPREAPDGRDRAAGADRSRAASGGLHGAAPGGGSPDGDSDDAVGDSRRVRRRATPAPPLLPPPDMQGRRGPGRPPTPPPDAEHTRRADALRAEREATGHDARLRSLYNFYLIYFV
jgi:hypothetical protein